MWQLSERDNSSSTICYNVLCNHHMHKLLRRHPTHMNAAVRRPVGRLIIGTPIAIARCADRGSARAFHMLTLCKNDSAILSMHICHTSGLDFR